MLLTPRPGFISLLLPRTFLRFVTFLRLHSGALVENGAKDKRAGAEGVAKEETLVCNMRPIDGRSVLEDAMVKFGPDEAVKLLFVACYL